LRPQKLPDPRQVTKYKFKSFSDPEKDEKNGDHHKEKGNSHNEYHVIAGDEKPDKVKIKVEIEKPLCHEHKPILMDVDSGQVHSLIPSSTAELTVYSKELPSVLDDPMQFLRNCWWLEKISPREYQISTNACAGNASLVATIKAFPDLKWKIEASIGLGTSGASADTEKDEIVIKGMDKQGLAASGMSAGATIEYEHNGKKSDLKYEFQEYVKTTLSLLNTAKRLHGRVRPMLKEMGNVEINIQWPNFSVEYAAAFEEEEDDYLVGDVWDLTLGLKPLIGIEGKTDITNWLIESLDAVVPGGPAAAKALKKIKTIAEEGIGEKKGTAHVAGILKIELSVRGQLLGTLGWKKEIKKEIKSEGNVNMEIGFQIEAIAQAEGHYCMVAFKVGAKAGAHMAVGIKVKAVAEENKPLYSGHVYFTGLTFYYAVYASLGSNAKEPEDESGTESEHGGGGDLKREVKVLPPWESGSKNEKHGVI
jgi:hypothetical protein